MSSQRIAGLLLVAIGGALLLATTTDVGGEVVVAGIGVAFLVSFAMSRNYGMLVPGGILTGLGGGIIMESLGAGGGSVPLGLGLGFVSIAVISQLTGVFSGSGWWWPFIPGGILTVVGGSEVLDLNLGAYVVPVVLIVIGLGLLTRPGRRSRAGDEPHP